MTLHQLDQFAECSTAFGLRVDVYGKCKCGSTITLISAGNGPHLAELRCESCDAHRGSVSQSTYRFISKIISRFGRLTAPIKGRRGGGTYPPTDSGEVEAVQFTETKGS
jgi:hypothetical protein